MKIRILLLTLLSSVAFNAFARECDVDMWSAEICAEKKERHEKWYKNYVESGQQEEMMRKVREGFARVGNYDQKCFAEFSAKADEFLYGKSINFVSSTEDTKTKECEYTIIQQEACMFIAELNALARPNKSNAENCRFRAELQRLTHEYKDVIYTPEFSSVEKEFYAKQKAIYQKHSEEVKKLNSNKQ